MPQVRVQVPNVLATGDDPSDHGPHGRATAPVSNITSTQHHNMLEDLSKGDEPLRHFYQEGGNPLQNFFCNNQGSSPIALPPITPLERAEKIKFPTYSGDTSTYEDWRNACLSIICSCFLRHLYDSNIDDIISTPNPHDDPKIFEDYNVYLYSKIILALPPGNTFIKAFNYRGKGITLWHAIHQDFRSRGSHSHIQSKLAFFYSKALVRNTSESVDDYWNRFQHLVRQLINNPEPHTFSQGYLRKRFLTTLGNGFEYLVEDEQNKRLDPALLHCTDVELISLLREIQANKSFHPGRR